MGQTARRSALRATVWRLLQARSETAYPPDRQRQYFPVSDHRVQSLATASCLVHQSVCTQRQTSSRFYVAPDRFQRPGARRSRPLLRRRRRRPQHGELGQHDQQREIGNGPRAGGVVVIDCGVLFYVFVGAGGEFVFQIGRAHV